MEVSLDDGGEAMNDGEYLSSAEWRPVRPEPRGAVRCGAVRGCLCVSFRSYSSVASARCGRPKPPTGEPSCETCQVAQAMTVQRLHR
jgi:hypothetical protein